MMLHKQVIIIGGGISGLTAGYQLKKNNSDFLLIESSNRTGGAIQTVYDKKYTFENGPNTFLLNDNRIDSIFKDLNLKIKDASPDSKNRYVLKNKKCLIVPNSFFTFLFSSLLSIKTKIIILFEFLNFKKAKVDEESVSEFIMRRLNKEVLDYTINPFIAGTYAGDPNLLSIKYAFPLLYNLDKKYGSLIRGIFKHKKSSHSIKRRSISFSKGLNELINNLTDNISPNIKLDSKVINITKKENKFLIEYKKDNELETISSDNIICTIPAYSLNKLLYNNNKNATFTNLSEIYYPPIISLTLAYKKNDFIDIFDGFGLLIPKKEKMNILGVLYISSLFKNRAPKDENLITVFIGGSRQPDLINLDNDMLISLVSQDLKQIYGLKDKPIYTSKKVWNNSIPQYNIGFEKYINSIKKFEKNNKGFYFTGNFINGIALQNNMLNALEVVNNVNKKSYKYD